MNTVSTFLEQFLILLPLHTSEEFLTIVNLSMNISLFLTMFCQVSNRQNVGRDETLFTCPTSEKKAPECIGP